MSPRSVRSCTAALLALGALACAKSGDAPTSTADATRATYDGVFATGAKSGIVQLTTGTPATGTLTMTGGATVPLTGSYDAKASTFAVSGGGYSITAAVSRTQELTGALWGASSATSGVLAAYRLNQAAPSLKVCGTFAGSMAGTLNAVVSGTSVLAIAVDGAGNGMTASGTLNGSAITFDWLPLGYVPSNVTGTATGVLTGPSSGAGTWSMTNGQHGTWTAAGC